MAIIWHLSVIKNSSFTLVSGLIISGYKQAKKESGFKRLGSIPGSYLNRVYANRVIYIGNLEEVVKSSTDKYGAFQINQKDNKWSEIQIFDEEMNEILDFQKYPSTFIQKEAGPLVISDIDDTIMRSFTKTKVKRFMTTLFKPASKRKVISYTQKLYLDIGSDADFYYVSKSENNLFHLIADFLLHNELPLGPLFLTPFLSFSQLIQDKKDASFKKKSICYILDHTVNKSIILIGDDTQADMHVYTEIVKLYGSRIEKVYIRQTKNKNSSEQITYWNKLLETGVTAVYFKHDEIFNS